ncbi:MAG: MBL fold metallo-hydrolase [Phycisphaerales bacterium]|nr:MAG: MBL fold metallo-hydrolase [Phycisphaerales bacterium]
MSLHFMSLRSSSSGNCLLVWTDRTRVLIDCGLGSMKRTRRVLTQNLGDQLDIDAAVVTHMHTDHIGYYSLRVLESHGVAVIIHESCLPQLRGKHFNGRGLSTLQLKPFADSGFKIGDLRFQAFEVPHDPWYPTYGFVVKYRRSKIVIATDFCYWDSLLEHFVDSDFIFVECNHDLELLARYYNPNSQFHMPNPDTGELLCAVRQCSKRPPRAVMLGHLSEIRNRPDIALREVESSFEIHGLELGFPLLVAPRLHASEVIEVNHSSKACVAMQES